MMDDLKPGAYVTPSFLAKVLGVSRVTVWRWIKDGKIKYIRTPGGRYLIPVEEVERILGASDG